MSRLLLGLFIGTSGEALAVGVLSAQTSFVQTAIRIARGRALGSDLTTANLLINDLLLLLAELAAFRRLGGVLAHKVWRDSISSLGKEKLLKTCELRL